VPRLGLGQQVQRSSSGWIPHDRIIFPQICSSRSLPLHRPRQSALRYPAVAANRYSIHSVQRDPPLVHEPLPRRPTCFIGSIPITHLIRGIQIPIVNAAPPTSLSRGFLHQRFADAGPPSARRHLHGAAIRKPSCSRRFIAAWPFLMYSDQRTIRRLSRRKTSPLGADPLSAERQCEHRQRAAPRGEQTGCGSPGKYVNPTISGCCRDVWAKRASLIFIVFQHDHPNPHSTEQ
jgi:hypothetical protein